MDKKMITQANASIKPLEKEWLTGLNELSANDLQQIVGGIQFSISKDGDTKLNRDESANFYAEITEDSVGVGLGNVISPNDLQIL